MLKHDIAFNQNQFLRVKYKWNILFSFYTEIDVCIYVFRTLKCEHFYQWVIYKKCTELSLKKCLQWSMERKYIYEKN